MSPSWAGGSIGDGDVLKTMLIPSNPLKSFKDVWTTVKMRFDRNYSSGYHLQGWFYKLQTEDGSDIDLTDQIGSCGFGPHSSTDQLRLRILQLPIDREGSVAPSSSLQPLGHKRPNLSEHQQQHAKRRRLLSQDEPLRSRESESQSHDSNDEHTHPAFDIDSQGFTIPPKPGRPALSEANDILVHDSQAHHDAHKSPSLGPIDDHLEIGETIDLPGPAPAEVQDVTPTQLDLRASTLRREPSTSAKKVDLPISPQTSRASSLPGRRYVSAEDISSTQGRLRRPSHVSTRSSLSLFVDQNGVDNNDNPEQPGPDVEADEAYAASEGSDHALPRSPPTSVEPVRKRVTPTPKWWNEDEDAVLLSCRNRPTGFIAKRLRSELGTVRSGSAIRSRRLLLIERSSKSGSAVPSSSPAASGSVPASSPAPQQSQESPLLTKRPASALPPKTPKQGSNFTSVNDAQDQTATRQTYRGFARSAVPSVPIAGPAVKTPSSRASSASVKKSASKQTMLPFLQDAVPEPVIGKGKQPAAAVRAHYDKMNTKAEHEKQRVPSSHPSLDGDEEAETPRPAQRETPNHSAAEALLILQSGKAASEDDQQETVAMHGDTFDEGNDDHSLSLPGSRRSESVEQSVDDFYEASESQPPPDASQSSVEGLTAPPQLDDDDDELNQDQDPAQRQEVLIDDSYAQVETREDSQASQKSVSASPEQTHNSLTNGSPTIQHIKHQISPQQSGRLTRHPRGSASRLADVRKSATQLRQEARRGPITTQDLILVEDSQPSPKSVASEPEEDVVPNSLADVQSSHARLASNTSSEPDSIRITRKLDSEESDSESKSDRGQSDAFEDAVSEEEEEPDSNECEALHDEAATHISRDRSPEHDSAEPSDSEEEVAAKPLESAHHQTTSGHDTTGKSANMSGATSWTKTTPSDKVDKPKERSMTAFDRFSAYLRKAHIPKPPRQQKPAEGSAVQLLNGESSDDDDSSSDSD